jgi:GNAT superfamily N-acetyltransferase
MAKGEKNFKKLIPKEKLAEEEKHSFLGSIPINSHVKVKLNDEDKICRIVSIRQDPKSKKDEPPNEYSYEYYIHYLEYDRRNDHWIQRKDISDTKVTDEEIKKIKNNQIPTDEIIFHNDENEGMDEAGVKAHEEATKVRTIDEIVMGNYRCCTWYFSPFPEEYHNEKTLYFCEFCLNFYVKKEELERHLKTNCLLRHPPGNEIYRDDKISMFEVDGKTESIYCENLSYLSKLFLDHKTLQWDVEPFLFYILTEYDKYGYHFVGYFSKEKESREGWNLSCILTMPFHQRKGYGKFLIEFSYLLSRKEQKYGSPERPLSDLGFSTYFAFWTKKICETLKNWEGDLITINDIAEKTYIKQSDIHNVMSDLQLLKYHEGNYIIIADKKILEELEKRTGKSGYPLHPEKLIWTPYKNKYDL